MTKKLSDSDRKKNNDIDINNDDKFDSIHNMYDLIEHCML